MYTVGNGKLNFIGLIPDVWSFQILRGFLRCQCCCSRPSCCEQSLETFQKLFAILPTSEMIKSGFILKFSCDSVTRLDDFLKVLADNFSSKIFQIFGAFWGYCEKHQFLSRNCCGYFCKNMATFFNIWTHWIVCLLRTF